MLRLVAGVAAALALGIPPAPARADVGHRDQSFAATSVTKPSGEKPQSKLWYVDGRWWGSLFDVASGEYRVHAFDPAGQRWVATGTVLDERNSSHGDALWDGSHLYFASGSDQTTNPGIRVRRLSYDAGARTWSVDPGYPATIAASTPIEAVVIDEDATGRLWMTYTQNNPGGGRTVFVAHTTGHPADVWGTPYALPADDAGNLSADDISSVVAYPGGVGVMWSNQTTQAIYFAFHRNGAGDLRADWTREMALGGRLSADDHLNLKSVQADPAGRVFAAAKTSYGDDPMSSPFAPQVLLLVRDPFGAWGQHPVGTIGEDHTRPIVMTDQRSRRLYVLATSPTVADGRQAIYLKSADLDEPVFPSGSGTRFMGSDAGGFDVNDASSTKQDLAAIPDMLVLGSDVSNYWHNVLPLGHTDPDPGPTPDTTPDPTPPPTPTPTPSTTPAAGLGPGSPAAASDLTPLRVSRLSARPSRFRVARGRFAPTSGRGTRLVLTLSERGIVHIRTQRARAGRRAAGRCVRLTRANRSARRCTRFTSVPGVLSGERRPGTNRIKFSGRLDGRALPPGRYRLVVVATDAAGNASRPARVVVRILPDRKAR